MTQKQREYVYLNREAVRAVIDFRGMSDLALMRMMGQKSAKALRRWLAFEDQMAISRKNLLNMASALHCKPAHLTGEEPVTNLIFARKLPAPGTPEFYARAIAGSWRGMSYIHTGKNKKGEPIPPLTLEWLIDLKESPSGDPGCLVGNCESNTPFGRGQYDLIGQVNGMGLLAFDGVRGVGDGAVQIVRGLLLFFGNNNERQMTGAYSMWWAEHEAIFTGNLELKPIVD